LKDAFEFFKTKKSDFSIDLYGKGMAAEKAAKIILNL
jgi:hypothetical protein